MTSYQLHHGDCLEVMATMADNSVDAIVTDPPYFKVKSEWWDRQWDKPAEFLAWLDQVAEQWQRILKPNGSLYCFASSKMAARVEVMLGGRFCVLANITWTKPNEPGYDGWHKKCSKDALRQWYPMSERLIFCEHYGADNIAKGEAGYGAKCDELRGFVFEPLRAYLDGERQKAGITPRQVNEYTNTQMAGHWFTQVQWALPTAKHYANLRQLFNANGSEYLRREYEDLRREYEDLRREYEDLRREYEDLRRPFSVSADVPYTDVWTFPTVQHYPGKHPCEKPAAMLEHIIAASTRPGAVVLDCFAGSGATLLAAKNLGRLPIGIEIDDHWVQVAKARLEGNQPPQRPTRQPAPASPGQLALF
jgi:site-specific DNA-methyltransferase (adenine-specific)